MSVRRSRDQELDEVALIWHEARKEAHTSMAFETERSLTAEDSGRIFRDVIAPHCEIWVAEQENVLLGFLAIRGSYVDRMYVQPGAQRGGVGSALLARARQLSPSGLELHTHQQNQRARRFYEKHGFRAVAFGVSPAPESEPDVEYHWRPA
jgi:ribosomal protein S18 acetylase RimI-like enzyme